MTIEEIIKLAAEFNGLAPSALQRRTRKGEIVQSRQLAHYLAIKKTKLSTTEIGKRIGGLDHATVLHSVKTIENYLTVKSEIKMRLEEFFRVIENEKKKVIIPDMVRASFKETEISYIALLSIAQHFRDVAKGVNAKAYFNHTEDIEHGIFILDSAAFWLDKETTEEQFNDLINIIKSHNLTEKIEFLYKDETKNY